MISEDFAFFGFDEASWERLVSLFARGDEPRGVLVVVVNSAAIPVASFHTERGSLDPTALPPPGDLEGLCEATEARACIIMRERAIGDVANYLAEPLDDDDDFVGRMMRFVHVLRELGNGNWIRVWPNPLPSFLLAVTPAAKPATDLLLPDGHAVVLGVFEEGSLWTAAVLRRNGGELDVFAGPRAISEWTGPLGGAWERDHRVVSQSVERELGPVHLGLFMERHTAERLFRGREAGDWALAFATREIMVHPFPSYAAAGLGFDVLRGTAQMAMEVLQGLEPEEMASIAQGFWKGFTDGKGLEGLLGFSPKEAISKVLEKTLSDRPSAPEPAGPAAEPPATTPDSPTNGSRSGPLT